MCFVPGLQRVRIKVDGREIKLSMKVKILAKYSHLVYIGRHVRLIAGALCATVYYSLAKQAKRFSWSGHPGRLRESCYRVLCRAASIANKH